MALQMICKEKPPFLHIHALYVCTSVSERTNIFDLVCANRTAVMPCLEHTWDRTSGNDSTFSQNVFESGSWEPLANCRRESTNCMKCSHPKNHVLKLLGGFATLSLRPWHISPDQTQWSCLSARVDLPPAETSVILYRLSASLWGLPQSLDNTPRSSHEEPSLSLFQY